MYDHEPGKKGISMSVEETIREKLEAAFSPVVLQVANESHGHNVAEGAESHFKIVLVSRSFEGVRAVARHQMIYSVLADDLAAGVHALALHTYTPDQWQVQLDAPESPPCLGGAKP